MALPPTIPTSFVPHPSERRKYRSDFSGTLPFVAYFLLGVSVVLAGIVFFYGRVLSTEQKNKDAQLVAATQSIDNTTAEHFVQLRDRLENASTLLDTHVAFSNIFAALQQSVPTTVRLKQIHLTTDDNGMTTIQGTGVAKNFNALAATSHAFAEQGDLNDAIFSSIGVNKDNSVAFTLTATIDPKLLAFAAPSTASETPMAPAETDTTATTTDDSAAPTTP